MTFDYSSRIEGLRGRMVEAEVEVTILSVGADLPYFTGYEALASERLTVLVVTDTGASLLVPQLEAPRVVVDHVEVALWGELDDPVAMASSLVANPSRVAVGDHMWSVFLTRFQKQWTSADWIPSSDLTTRLRVIKDAEEVGLLRSAAHAVDRVMNRIPSGVRFYGRTEAQVARDLAELTIEEGHDEASFAIVGSGPNGASPHHDAGDRVIQDGDLVVCDFGGRFDGYFSDSTRTFAVGGEPSAQQMEVHAVVQAANEAGRAAVAPGVLCKDVDRAARHVIDEAGYGELFIHRTGHGIGLEVHEHPYIVSGNDQSLEAGMTFSVEPGVYISGEYGVRIEDIVVCADDGIESLNQASRDLVSVG